MEPIIEVRNVIKTYKLYDKPIDRLKESLSLSNKKYHQTFNALDGLNLNIFPGEAVGFLGRNGSGKSTLLKLITGILTPTHGEIITNGRISAILELGAGFNPEYTGRENIYLNGLMLGISREEMNLKIESIIEFADIGSFIEQPVKLYSSGMFARLAFAVSINVDPDILIVDEALAVGDSRFQTKCIEKMKELKQKGVTILFVSHATEQVKRFCNKAVWIKEGKIEAVGESSEVVDIYESYMKTDSANAAPDVGQNKVAVDEQLEEIETPTVSKVSSEYMAYISKVKVNKKDVKTFDEVIVEIEYEVYESNVKDLLLGVALYTPNREYIFGPNTFLEKIDIPQTLGKHTVRYIVSQIPLLGGTYCIDIGLFNNEGLVCLHYKENAESISITNKYISEGLVYMNHRWEVVQ
ncbi:ABC transporter ATP-binding protein [Paenibacillus wulumuqiensis]|uniref:ABC transporter ATP-binding protein n=1 Tax=Paenibacillus wulumuqiensis TaxID=1567107 RepID=UPI0006194314|nr:ABC transporter ATP-binding protein [Paenibacillus wulumuqiensis]